MKTLSPQILAFYLGCNVETPDGIGKLHSVELDAAGSLDRVHVHFGRMVKTKNSIDVTPSGAGYKLTRNHGDYKLNPERWEAIATSDGSMPGVMDIPGGVKPILRKISSMTEEEQDESGILYPDHGSRWSPKQIHYLLSHGFDLFNLIEENLAIDSSSIEKPKNTICKNGCLTPSDCNDDCND